MKRRTVLIGLGTVVAASGAAVGTSAFTTVETQRSVSVKVTEDSQALVGIDVDDRYGSQTEAGAVEFDLQSKVFDGNGFNPEGKTILYGALAVTNNSGIEGDEMELQLAYESESGSVTVPGGQEVPKTSYSNGEQFYFRQSTEGNIPNADDAFEGLDFSGPADEIADPGAVGQGDTTVLDLVVDPGGELERNEDYSVNVTIVANISGNP